jgi:long-chain fatty acid transport protein
MVTATSMSLVPAFFAPNPPDAFGFASFPDGTNARPFWGGGFQFGAFYEATDDWNVGFSYKSPIWQERWSFNSATPNLFPRRIGVQATIPEIFSWGVAYKGLPRTLIDVDFRYVDYGNAALFGQSPANGGLGWRSVFAVALGAQYQATDRLTFRAGYLYNQNPIPHELTLFNVQLPGIITNTLAFGSSIQVNDNVVLSVAWTHGFRNSIQGDVKELPGAFTRFDTQVDSIQLGFNIRFGASRRAAAESELAAVTPASSPPSTP